MKMAWAKAALWAVVLAGAGTALGEGLATTASSQPGGAAAVKKNLPLVAVARIVTGDNSDGTREAVETLSTIYSVMEAKDRTLRQVTDNMRGAWGVNIAVNWADLKQEGIEQDTLLSYHLEGVSGAQTIETVMAVAAPGKLQYSINDGVVEIGTRARAGRLDVARVYDPETLAKKQFHGGMTGDATAEDTALKERAGTKKRAEKLADVLKALADPELMAAKTTIVDYKAEKVGVRGPADLHWELSGIYDDMRHPIHVPVTASEAATEMKASGEPLKLPSRLRATAALRAAQKELAAPMELFVDNHPLDKTLRYMQDATGLNMVVDWRGLEEVGIKRDAAVSLKKTNDSIEKVLASVLAAVGETGKEGAAKDVIGMVVSNEGVVTISARKYAVPEQTTAVFDVRDVIKRGIFTAPTGKKPTTLDLAGAIMEGLNKAGEDEGWGKRVKMVEYEGLVCVRGTPTDIRVIGRHLAALAK